MKIPSFLILITGMLALLLPAHRGVAQDDALVFSTINRAPFSLQTMDGHEGFSIDLMRAIASDLGREVEFQTVGTFPDMLDRVIRQDVDGAIANISITSAREEQIDFSQPIFESGLKILVPVDDGTPSILRALLTRDILYAVLIALGMLFGGGFLMWLFERRKQPYFDRPLREAMFPSFWWALNLVVNGGFEERMPQSRPGRIFSVMLVVASLFVVSVFVAQITAAVTVEALQENIDSVNDLDGRHIGTVRNSTAAGLLTTRDLSFSAFDDPGQMFAAFETGGLDALVFDAPILAYYATMEGRGKARLLPRNYRPENYGIALPENSALREPINQALLRLRENGTYDDLIDKWFGNSYRP